MSSPRQFSENFGRFWTWMTPSVDKRLEPIKTEIGLRGLSGRIIEIGAGAGPNFKYYNPSKVDHVTAIEPNAVMHAKLTEEAAKHGFTKEKGNLTILLQALEDVVIAPESADAIVSTLVLCSVTSLPGSAKQLASWLKPGGKLLFLEHVAYKPNTFGLSFQKYIRDGWAYIGDGCDLTRQTHEVLKSDGNLDVTILGDQRDTVYSIAPQVWGFATKSKL
ncbi:hypothetical protein SmJEL517_g00973 [Synchytrium microbalum]|uniref:Methyltransferase type 11 domain-containing protein n=1 Tax=Synchytrium microbalum TaxID=1806994 RepID=A0A507C5S8_9FUNG|nr:uncharacterized protein SmJEL517_g00973 [Synchytrium microbalum]TPX36940.1 hypothetical protein SmJEL517_g00973 [Synchytrium microbalum]